MNNLKLSNLIDKMKSSDIDAAIVSSLSNIRYFSGFTGSSATLFLANDLFYLLTDFRYIEQAKSECPLFQIIDASGNKVIDFIKEVCLEKQISNVWFEDGFMTYREYATFKEAFGTIEMVGAGANISNIRMIKNETEIASMRKAAALADDALAYIKDFIQPGITEREISIQLEYYLKRKGSLSMAFDIIVASGENAALPHAKPSMRRIQKDDHIVLDFGAVVDGYRSDMTRTLIIGKPLGEISKIYTIVLEAQNKALSALKAGVEGKIIDEISRSHIAQNGYGQYFGHGLGHGVGLDIHENPRLSEKSVDILEENMVVTVEPGIYLPRKGGVRIEDMVLIKKDGIENFTRSPK